MGMIVGMFFLGGLAASAALIPVSAGFFVLSTALTRQVRHWKHFLVYGIVAAVIFALGALALFNTGGGAPTGSDYGDWLNGGFVLGVSPGAGFTAASLIIAIQQSLTRIWADINSTDGSRGMRILGLLAACVPLILALGIIGGGYSSYREPASRSNDLPFFDSLDNELLAKAEANNIQAQGDVGLWHLERVKDRGEFGPDCVEAINWFERAAYQGDADAQYHLGAAYDRCAPFSNRGVPVYAWFRIAAANPGISEEHQYAIYRRYETDGRGVSADELLATEQVVDHVLELFADTESQLGDRAEEIESVLDPYIEEALAKTVRWGTVPRVREPVNWLMGAPGGVVSSSPETEALGIANKSVDVFGIIELPLGPEYSRIAAVESPQQSNAVVIVVPEKNAADRIIAWQPYFLPPELVQLDPQDAHTIISIPDLSQPAESREHRRWYRSAANEWKRVPAEGEASREIWMEDWATMMETDEITAGNPLVL